MTIQWCLWLRLLLQKLENVDWQRLFFPVSKCSAHAKTLNSFGTVPICPKTDVLYKYKQFFKAHGGIMHTTEIRHCSMMRTHIGQKKTPQGKDRNYCIFFLFCCEVTFRTRCGFPLVHYLCVVRLEVPKAN